MGEGASKHSVIAQNGRNWFWFTRRGGMQSLHRASPFAASSACSPGRIARCYWGENNVMPALQNMQTCCFASTVSIYPAGRIWPKKCRSASGNCAKLV